MRRDYMTPKEYADAQNELGSCKSEFRDAVSRSTKFGSAVGVPFGVYVGYRHHGLNMRPLVATSISTWFATSLTFVAIGVMTGTYNCLRIKT